MSRNHKQNIIFRPRRSSKSAAKGVITILKAAKLKIDIELNLIGLIEDFSDDPNFSKDLSRLISILKYNDKLNNEQIADTIFRLLKHDNKKFIREKILPFLKGFGRLEHEDSLLAIAERAARKSQKERGSYEFRPTILLKSEFKEYLEYLKTLPLPITERFIISGSHWISGEIQIDEQGIARFLLMESSGIKPSQNVIDPYCPVHTFKKLFPQDHHKIYSDTRLRQGALGCSVFAIDDVNHLTTQTYEANLFDLLEKNKAYDFLVMDKIPDIHEFKRVTILTRNPPSLVQFDSNGNKINFNEKLMEQENIKKIFSNDINSGEVKNIEDLLSFEELLVLDAKIKELKGHTSVKNIRVGQCWIQQCDLPLSLLRATMSRDILNYDIKGRTFFQRQATVNKKGETAEQSILRGFGMTMDIMNNSDLRWAKNLELIEEDYQNAKRTNTPILMKKDDKYFIYGLHAGEWKTSNISEFLEAGQKQFLDTYPLGIIKLNNPGLTESSLKAFKSGHMVANQRLSKKLNSMTENILLYLLKTPEQEVVESLKKFTLEGFKRIDHAPHVQPKIH